jgi:hypothetical protein
LYLTAERDLSLSGSDKCKRCGKTDTDAKVHTSERKRPGFAYTGSRCDSENIADAG